MASQHKANELCPTQRFLLYCISVSITVFLLKIKTCIQNFPEQNFTSVTYIEPAKGAPLFMDPAYVYVQRFYWSANGSLFIDPAYGASIDSAYGPLFIIPAYCASIDLSYGPLFIDPACACLQNQVRVPYFVILLMAPNLLILLTSPLLILLTTPVI